MLRQLFSVFIVISFFASCDPGFAVFLSNNSGKEKIVKFSSVRPRELLFRDSIQIADTSRLNFFSESVKRQSIVFTKKDTADNSYSFILEKGNRALLQFGMGGPDLNQKIIIDNSDTISLKNDRRTVLRKKLMYTTVLTSIE